MVMLFIKKKITSFCGFTLFELLIVLSVIGILTAISCPLYSNIYQECCVRTAMSEIVNMVREVKMNGLGGKYCAIAFDTTTGTLTMISGRGADGEWNTGDDEVARTIRLGGKGGVRFGYGGHGPLPGLGGAPDGVSFPGPQNFHSKH